MPFWSSESPPEGEQTERKEPTIKNEKNNYRIYALSLHFNPPTSIRRRKKKNKRARSTSSKEKDTHTHTRTQGENLANQN